MNMSLKIVVSIVIISALLLSLGYLLFIKIRPLLIKTNYPESVWATIHGTISIPNDEIKNGFIPSQLVSIKLPYYNTQYLCRSNNVALANITWLNKTTGIYSVTFNLPVPMDVYVTGDCTGCNHQLVSLKNADNKTIDFTLDSRKCEEKIEFNDNPIDVRDSADRHLDGLKVELESKKFNQTETNSIGDDIRRGREAIAESKRENNFTQSLLEAYYSQWYTWKAVLKINLFDLKDCVADIQRTLDNHNNSLCFVPEYSAYKDFQSANLTASSYYDNYVYGYPERFSDINSVKNDINGIYNQNAYVDLTLSNCNNAKDFINKTLELQNQFCESKESAVVFFKYFPPILWIITILGIGILIGKWLYENKASELHGKKFNK